MILSGKIKFKIDTVLKSSYAVGDTFTKNFRLQYENKLNECSNNYRLIRLFKLKIKI